MFASSDWFIWCIVFIRRIRFYWPCLYLYQKERKVNKITEMKVLDIKLVTLQCSVVYIAGSQPLGNANLICSIHMYRIKLSFKWLVQDLTVFLLLLFTLDAGIVEYSKGRTTSSSWISFSRCTRFHPSMLTT